MRSENGVFGEVMLFHNRTDQQCWAEYMRNES